MRQATFPLLLSLSTFLPTVLSWGSLGHQTVAYVATNFVSPRTTTLFQTLLHNDTDHYLASVATWADSFRYTAAGRFSAPLHFIDAEDKPPRSCGIEYVRDCGDGGCVVGAILNYTSQLLDSEMVAWRKTMAAKFIIHFLGDIHQPLHTEGLLRGGNSIPVNFTSKTVNLHHVWDTSIPEHLIGGYSLTLASAWAQNLTLSIQGGAYAPFAKEWLEGIDFEDPIETALGWAREANAFVCTHVLPKGVEGVVGKELSGEYYEEGVVVVQLQVARAGLRLARWLDLIAAAVEAERGEL